MSLYKLAVVLPTEARLKTFPSSEPNCFSLRFSFFMNSWTILHRTVFSCFYNLHCLSYNEIIVEYVKNSSFIAEEHITKCDNVLKSNKNDLTHNFTIHSNGNSQLRHTIFMKLLFSVFLLLKPLRDSRNPMTYSEMKLWEDAIIGSNRYRSELILEMKVFHNAKILQMNLLSKMFLYENLNLSVINNCY